MRRKLKSRFDVTWPILLTRTTRACHNKWNSYINKFTTNVLVEKARISFTTFSFHNKCLESISPLIQMASIYGWINVDIGRGKYLTNGKVFRHVRHSVCPQVNPYIWQRQSWKWKRSPLRRWFEGGEKETRNVVYMSNFIAGYMFPSPLPFTYNLVDVVERVLQTKWNFSLVQIETTVKFTDTT